MNFADADQVRIRRKHRYSLANGASALLDDTVKAAGTRHQLNVGIFTGYLIVGQSVCLNRSRYVGVLEIDSHNGGDAGQ